MTDQKKQKHQEFQKQLALKQARLNQNQSFLLDIQETLKKKQSFLKSFLEQLKQSSISTENKSSFVKQNLVTEEISLEKFWLLVDPVLNQQLKGVKNSSAPTISILTPTYNSSLDWFVETVLSVLNQSISCWEWCLVDDGSKCLKFRDILKELSIRHPRIKVLFQQNSGISSATNKALEMAETDYVCFLDHDDTLTPTALEESLKKLLDGFDITYSDEDKIDQATSQYIEPFFKPDWSPEYFRGVMYIGHLLCVRKELAIQVGKLKTQYDGVQDYEFALRLSEITDKIGHIPKILYHWRKIRGSIASDPYAKSAIIEKLQETAVTEHLKRLSLPAKAKQINNHRLKIIPFPRDHYPLISIIIPTKDAPEHLGRCLNSIYTLSTYANFEVILVDNETSNLQALKIMKEFPVKRVFLSNPFNYSHANNLGVEFAEGDYLVFLNNDTEVITEDWLQNLLYYAEQPDIGAVGALLLFPDKTVQHAGVALGIRGTADHIMRNFPSDLDGYAGSLICAREVSAVTGACMMLKKEDFLKVEGFNEHFFTHYQDVDLCLKLRANHQRIIYTPQAALFHYESATRKDDYDLVDRYFLLDLWQDAIDRGDPFYNCNFSLEHYDYTIMK